MTTIKTPAGDILSLRLPKDATDIGFTSLNPPYIALSYRAKDSELEIIYIPEGNWEIAGPISHDGKFGFDPSPFVYRNVCMDMKGWSVDYSGFNIHGHFPDSKSCFMAEVESQGEILWSNPMDEPQLEDYRQPDLILGGDFVDFEGFESDIKEWQSNEAKRVKENELILIIVNR